MSTLILVVITACIFWLAEMLMLAKEDWTVSRKTPMSNCMGAKGNSFCSIFWGTSFLYLIFFLVVAVLSHLLVFLGIGIFQLLAGIATDNSATIILIIACCVFALAVFVIYKVTSMLCGKIKKVTSEKPALIKLYNAIKEKYCPILK
jgi:hypothetical protein